MVLIRERNRCFSFSQSSSRFSESSGSVLGDADWDAADPDDRGADDWDFDEPGDRGGDRGGEPSADAGVFATVA